MSYTAIFGFVTQLSEQETGDGDDDDDGQWLNDEDFTLKLDWQFTI